MPLTALDYFRNGYNIHADGDQNRDRIGEIERSELVKPGSKLVLLLGKDGEIPGHRYMHAIRIVSRVPSLLPEVRQSLRDVLREVEFGSIASIHPLNPGNFEGSRVYLFASPDAIDGAHVLAQSDLRVRPDDPESDRAWVIDLLGTGQSTRLPGDNGLAWELELDPQNVTVIPGGALRIAAGIATDDEPQDRIRNPRISLDPRQAAFDLSILPEGWREDAAKRLIVAGACYHQFKGDQAGLQLFRSWVGATLDVPATRAVYTSARRSSATWSTLRRELIAGLAFEHCRKALDLPDAEDQTDEAHHRRTRMTHRERVSLVSRYDLGTVHAATIAVSLIAPAEAEGLEITKGDVLREIKMGIQARKREQPAEEMRVEEALAEEVLRVYFGGGNSLRHANGQFRRFYKGIWRKCSADLIRSKVVHVIRSIGDDAPELRAIVDKHRNTSVVARGTVQTIADLVDCEEHDDPLGYGRTYDTPVFNVLNGELWWNARAQAFELRRHDWRSLMTIQLAVAYEPDAKCPRFLQMVQDTFAELPDRDEVARHYLECMAYTLNLSRTLDMFVLSIGDGRNGKSTLTRIMAQIAGLDRCVFDEVGSLDRSKNKHANESLPGKLLYCDDDVNLRREIPADVIKKMANHYQTVMVDEKQKSPIQVKNFAVLWLLANGTPRIQDSSSAIAARAEMFRHTGKWDGIEAGEIANLDRIVFEAEGPGILAQLVRSMTALTARGGFDRPASCRANATDLADEMAELGSFFRERCILSKARQAGHDPGAKVQDLFQAYQEWSVGEGLRRTMTKTEMTRALRSTKGLREYRLDNMVAFHGIRLRNVSAEAAAEAAETERAEAEAKAKARAHLRVVEPPEA
jgi:putative DNA primase/helicase